MTNFVERHGYPIYYRIFGDIDQDIAFYNYQTIQEQEVSCELRMLKYQRSIHDFQLPIHEL